MYNRMKERLSTQITINSSVMYGDTSSLVMKDLQSMTKILQVDLEVAGKGSRDTLYKDFDNMISVAGHGERLELEARKKKLQEVIISEVTKFDSSCTKDNENLAAQATTADAFDEFGQPNRSGQDGYTSEFESGSSRSDSDLDDEL
jgi:hypothetical protein